MARVSASQPCSQIPIGQTNPFAFSTLCVLSVHWFSSSPCQSTPLHASSYRRKKEVEGRGGIYRLLLTAKPEGIACRVRRVRKCKGGLRVRECSGSEDPLVLMGARACVVSSPSCSRLRIYSFPKLPCKLSYFVLFSGKIPLPNYA